MPLVATISCVMMPDNTDLIPASIPALPTGQWSPQGDSKVSASGSAVLTSACTYTITDAIPITGVTAFTASATAGSTQTPTGITPPAVFTFTPTAQKVQAGGKPVLCQGDKAQTMLTFWGKATSPSGPQDVSYPVKVTIEITQAGQTKVQAT